MTIVVLLYVKDKKKRGVLVAVDVAVAECEELGGMMQCCLRWIVGKAVSALFRMDYDCVS